MIDQIKSRLASTVPALKFVGEAADFQGAVESNPTATPAAYVIQLGEQPSPNGMADLLIQRVRASIGIVLVVRNLGDAKGVAARGAMDQLRKQVKDQVYGWQPEPELDPLERGESNLLAFRDGHMWWQDIYITHYYDKSTQ